MRDGASLLIFIYLSAREQVSGVKVSGKKKKKTHQLGRDNCQIFQMHPRQEPLDKRDRDDYETSPHTQTHTLH